MISDILLDACEEITDWLDEFPQHYTRSDREEIRELHRRMEALALKLARHPRDAELTQEDTPC